MRLTDCAPLLLLALPLGSCASSEKLQDVAAAPQNAAQARLPEVRYYVIADT
jgi:hypothetical protein